jgi:hypothetical protein
MWEGERDERPFGMTLWCVFHPAVADYGMGKTLARQTLIGKLEQNQRRDERVSWDDFLRGPLVTHHLLHTFCFLPSFSG